MYARVYGSDRVCGCMTGYVVVRQGMWVYARVYGSDRVCGCMTEYVGVRQGI